MQLLVSTTINVLKIATHSRNANHTHQVTVLQTCKHELPTIEFCPEAVTCVKKPLKKGKRGIEALLPATCTDSLGWTMFKSVDAPVVCEGCKMWLYLTGKATYSMLQDIGSMMDQEDEKSVDEGVGEKKDNDNKEEEAGQEGDKKATPAKQTGVNEMQKLQSKLSRTFGVTGQRRKKAF